MENTKKIIWMSAISFIFFVMLALPLPAMAQDGEMAEQTQTFTQEQLAQLLAPIALYPDELITQVLLASTYPLEIVMADRWVQQNKDLKGSALASALEKETWDPSVKSLVNFPTVLAMLSQKLDLTTKLGDAFLEQQDDVMDTVQELRKKAADAGNLSSTREQKVVIEGDNIAIEPADTRVIYVPVYDPYVVYGPWWYPAYPPYYFYPRPYSGVAFSFGIGVTLGLPWGYAWGGWDWYNHNVYININRNSHYNRYIDRTRYIRHYERRGQPVRDGQAFWQHDPRHRRGVAYKDMDSARKFGQLPARQSVTRPESRGFRTPSQPVQGTRSAIDSQRTRRSTSPSGSAEQKIIKQSDGGRVVTPPKATGESIFSGGNNNSSRARRSSERGRQSAGGNHGQPSRTPALVMPKVGGGNRNEGGVPVPRKGERRDDNRR